jgi:hypothetical protein
MATFANLSDIVATTIQSRSGSLADNCTNNNALLYKLKERGNQKLFSGGNVILQEVMYNDPTTENAGAYSGYDIIDITPNSPISSAQFDIKQYAAAVSMSGLEMLQNSGKEQIIDLLEGRIQVAEAQLMNDISAGIYSDGTGNGGKDITGLALAVSASPGSGIYGGINRTNFSFWRNIAFDATTDGGAAACVVLTAPISLWQVTTTTASIWKACKPFSVFLARVPQVQVSLASNTSVLALTAMYSWMVVSAVS